MIPGYLNQKGAAVKKQLLFCRKKCHIKCLDSRTRGEYLSAYLKFTPWYTVFSVFVFWMLRLYNSVWRFVSYSELIRVGISTVITFLFQSVGITLVIQRSYQRPRTADTAPEGTG